MTERLIIVGASARAAAQSAVRGGFDAWCIDQFGDDDLRACAEHVEVVRNWPDGILDVIPRIPAGTLVITGALENAPRILARLRERLPFAGCGVDAMRALRDPVNLQQILRQAEADWLRVSLRDPLLSVGNGNGPTMRWLRKPLRSAAGFNIRFHEFSNAAVSDPPPLPTRRRGPARVYFQEFVDGESISGLFLSSGEDCLLLGLTRQLNGLPAAGCSGFRYCGSIGPLSTNDLPPQAFELAASTGRILTGATGCRGLFGCDFVWSPAAGTLHVCEVNPRVTASAEVLEQSGISRLMNWHMDACRGRLPKTAVEMTQHAGRYLGKLICFAECPYPAAALRSLPAGIELADIPREDVQIDQGHPICTVLSHGEAVSKVRSSLLIAANRIHEAAGNPG